MSGMFCHTLYTTFNNGVQELTLMYLITKMTHRIPQFCIKKMMFAAIVVYLRFIRGLQWLSER